MSLSLIFDDVFEDRAVDVGNKITQFKQCSFHTYMFMIMPNPQARLTIQPIDLPKR